MGLIDSLIIIVIIVGIVSGGMKGIVKQLTSLIAFVLAILIARAPGDELMEIMHKLIPELGKISYGNWAADILGHIILFVFVYLTVSLIGALVKTVVKGLHLGIFDRIGGAIFCSFKYLLALSLLLNLWLMVNPKNEVFSSPKIIDGSLYKFTLNLGPKVLNSTLLPMMTKTSDSDSKTKQP